MSFRDAIRSVLSQYATFSGRARRSEYWWWTLAYSLVVMGLYVVGLLLLVPTAATSETGSAELGATGIAGVLVLATMGLLTLALFLPSLAVLVRRLHDTGRSGWWYLISLVPFGGIVLLVFQVLDSTPGPNAYGPNPKGDGQDPYGYGAPVGLAQPGPYGVPAAHATPDPRFGTPPQG